MGLNHRYDLINEGEETKGLIDGKQLEPQHTTSRPTGTAWWKFLLSNLFAAVVGAAATLLLTGIFHSASPSSDVSAAAASSIATATTTTTPSANLALPTPPSELIKGDELTSGNMQAGEILTCGYSPEEARAKNCVYDVMMQDWVPEPCYDAVLTEKYLAMGNWTWYGDGDGNTTISDEVMRKGEHGAAWMSTSYHKAHCVFSWLKIIRALRNNRGISQELLSYDHVLHCAHGALKAEEDDEDLGVRAPTNYAWCALYDTWILDLVPDKHNSTQKRHVE